MKIFNWVHRRFNNKENGKKNGVVCDDEKQFVVDNVNSTNVIERWRGGILTIGTFGYDPLKDENEENDVYLYSEKDQINSDEILDDESSDEISTDSELEEEEEEKSEEYEDEEEPLVYTAYADDFERLIEMKNNVEGNKLEYEYVMMENTDQKKARTTLADLFIADSEEMKKKQPIKKGEMIIKEKTSNNCKNGFLFGKKLVADEARPIHKLHQLMRRMMKRKIHPDIGAINPKVSVKMCDTNDYASLLPTQDAIV